MKGIAFYLQEITTDGSVFDPILDTRLEYVFETAGVLDQKGFDVNIYANVAHSCVNTDVIVKAKSDYKPTDIVIAINERPPELGEKNIFVSCEPSIATRGAESFDCVIAQSNWYKEHILNGQNATVIYPACWPDQYANPIKVPKSCLYSSHPKRGLQFLLEIWPKIYAATGAHLTVTHNAPKQDIPGVTFTGVVPEHEMTEIYKRSQFWLSPALGGIETFNLSAYKAQAAQCVPIVVPNTSFDEVIVFGVKVKDISDYQDTLIETIQNPPVAPKITFPSWEDVTNQLISLFFA